jgi:membrane peptidoglycan carboxypeptidase
VRAASHRRTRKFGSHYGFDLEAIDKALANDASGGNVRGASTISQQTANLFLAPNCPGWQRD